MNTNKIALVTGGTSGIGLSLVKTLVNENYFVHFIGTNRDKGKLIESELNGAHGPMTRFIRLDLSDLEQVKTFIETFKTEVPHLDLLANIAGVLLNTRQEGRQGLEKTFTIGYLSAFMLSTGLISHLSEGNQARIVNVGLAPSMLLNRQLNFDDLNAIQNYSGRNVLIDTIHAKAVMTEILAEKLKSQSIDVNIFNPGAVRSEIGRDMPFPLKTIFSIVSRFFPKASKTGIYVTTSDQVAGITGQLFEKEKPTPLSFDQAYKDQLWKKTNAILGTVLQTPLSSVTDP